MFTRVLSYLTYLEMWEIVLYTLKIITEDGHNHRTMALTSLLAADHFPTKFLICWMLCCWLGKPGIEWSSAHQHIKTLRRKTIHPFMPRGNHRVMSQSETDSHLWQWCMILTQHIEYFEINHEQSKCRNWWKTGTINKKSRKQVVEHEYLLRNTGMDFLAVFYCMQPINVMEGIRLGHQLCVGVVTTCIYLFSGSHKSIAVLIVKFRCGNIEQHLID